MDPYTGIRILFAEIWLSSSNNFVFSSFSFFSAATLGASNTNMSCAPQHAAASQNRQRGNPFVKYHMYTWYSFLKSKCTSFNIVRPTPQTMTFLPWIFKIGFTFDCLLLGRRRGLGRRSVGQGFVSVRGRFDFLSSRWMLLGSWSNIGTISR